LSERGAPTPVVWTRLCPPQSLMGAVDAGAMDATAKASALWPKYAEEIDRESAREKLAGRLAEAQAAQAEVPREAPAPEKPPQPKGKGKKDDNPVVGYLKSRQGQSMINTVARGVFGLLRRR